MIDAVVMCFAEALVVSRIADGLRDSLDPQNKGANV